ncbi:MAG TPA: serine/threonine-protein kinase, partial [Polyangia bacterium]
MKLSGDCRRRHKKAHASVVRQAEKHRPANQEDRRMYRDQSVSIVRTMPGISRSSTQEFVTYTVQEKIASGGMADVYRATSGQPGTRQDDVVIKCLRACLHHDGELAQMLLDEAAILSQLSHPNIVAIVGAGISDDRYFIVMERIIGVDLASLQCRLQRQECRLPPFVAAEIVRQVAVALDYAHCRMIDGKPLNLVHRDISPSNIMISDAGVVKILDFGISKASGVVRTPVTAPGFIKGKWGYMAPEQAAAHPIDKRTDVFNCGIVLYELLSGRSLFPAANAWDGLRLLTECRVPMLANCNDQVPVRLDEIVRCALEKSQKDRWQSAGELADAIGEFLLEEGWSSSELTRQLRLVANGSLGDLWLPPMKPRA